MLTCESTCGAYGTETRGSFVCVAACVAACVAFDFSACSGFDVSKFGMTKRAFLCDIITDGLDATVEVFVAVCVVVCVAACVAVRVT